MNIFDLLSNHEILFALAAVIFSVGGFFAIQKKLPELLKKSMDSMDSKIDKIDSRMDSTDKKIQNVEVVQARNDEKINNIQTSQNEMKQSIAEIFRLLNTSVRDKSHGRE